MFGFFVCLFKWHSLGAYFLQTEPGLPFLTLPLLMSICNGKARSPTLQKKKTLPSTLIRNAVVITDLQLYQNIADELVKNQRKMKTSLFPVHSYHVRIHRKEEKCQEVIPSLCNPNTHTHTLFYSVILTLQMKQQCRGVKAFLTMAEQEVMNPWLSAITWVNFS